MKRCPEDFILKSSHRSDCLRDLDGLALTVFQQKVYAACQSIPCGKVASYQTIAKHIGCASCQAIGQALKRNPLAPFVPCHRVIASNRTLGGFKGMRNNAALTEKRQLLQAEGVHFDEIGRVQSAFILSCL